MRIGLDSDGVIRYCGGVKSREARRMYHVNVAPGYFRRGIVVGRGILTSEEYTALTRRVYATELGLRLPPVEGAIEYVQRLLQDGHKLKVVTSVTEGSISITQNWMLQKGLKVPVVSVEGKSKRKACRGLDVFVDDDKEKLDRLVGAVPHLFLFSWPYNRQEQLDGTGIQRIGSWEKLYEEIARIDRDLRGK